MPQPLDPDGTVLITGGTGGLGALLARHLVERHGARHLLLVSRRGLDAPGADELVASCGARRDGPGRGLRRQRPHRDQLLAAVPVEHPLTAVVHAAACSTTASSRSPPSGWSGRARPKVDAALHLHELTADLDLSAFVLFSSVAALIGSPGRATTRPPTPSSTRWPQRRRAAGLPATSLAWGLWADRDGMTGA